jgi:hypothetical protein
VCDIVTSIHARGSSDSPQEGLEIDARDHVLEALEDWNFDRPIFRIILEKHPRSLGLSGPLLPYIKIYLIGKGVPAMKNTT